MARKPQEKKLFPGLILVSARYQLGFQFKSWPGPHAAISAMQSLVRAIWLSCNLYQGQRLSKKKKSATEGFAA